MGRDAKKKIGGDPSHAPAVLLIVKPPQGVNPHAQPPPLHHCRVFPIVGGNEGPLEPEHEERHDRAVTRDQQHQRSDVQRKRRPWTARNPPHQRLGQHLQTEQFRQQLVLRMKEDDVGRNERDRKRRELQARVECAGGEEVNHRLSDENIVGWYQGATFGNTVTAQEIQPVRARRGTTGEALLENATRGFHCALRSFSNRFAHIIVVISNNQVTLCFRSKKSTIFFRRESSSSSLRGSSDFLSLGLVVRYISAYRAISSSSGSFANSSSYKMSKKSFEYEFGGPIGALITMLALPLLTTYLILASSMGHLSFSFSVLLEEFEGSLAGRGGFLSGMLEGSVIVVGWLAFCLVLVSSRAWPC